MALTLSELRKIYRSMKEHEFELEDGYARTCGGDIYAGHNPKCQYKKMMNRVREEIEAMKKEKP